MVEKDQKMDEDEEVFGNSRAFSAIYNGVDKNIFKIANIGISVQDDWETV